MLLINRLNVFTQPEQICEFLTESQPTASCGSVKLMHQGTVPFSFSDLLTFFESSPGFFIPTVSASLRSLKARVDTCLNKSAPRWSCNWILMLLRELGAAIARCFGAKSDEERLKALKETTIETAPLPRPAAPSSSPPVSLEETGKQAKDYVELEEVEESWSQEHPALPDAVEAFEQNSSGEWMLKEQWKEKFIKAWSNPREAWFKQELLREDRLHLILPFFKSLRSREERSLTFAETDLLQEAMLLHKKEAPVPNIPFIYSTLTLFLGEIDIDRWPPVKSLRSAFKVFENEVLFPEREVAFKAFIAHYASTATSQEQRSHRLLQLLRFYNYPSRLESIFKAFDADPRCCMLADLPERVEWFHNHDYVFNVCNGAIAMTLCDSTLETKEAKIKGLNRVISVIPLNERSKCLPHAFAIHSPQETELLTEVLYDIAADKSRNTEIRAQSEHDIGYQIDYFVRHYENTPKTREKFYHLMRVFWRRTKDAYFVCTFPSSLTADAIYPPATEFREIFLRSADEAGIEFVPATPETTLKENQFPEEWMGQLFAPFYSHMVLQENKWVPTWSPAKFPAKEVVKFCHMYPRLFKDLSPEMRQHIRLK